MSKKPKWVTKNFRKLGYKSKKELEAFLDEKWADKPADLQDFAKLKYVTILKNGVRTVKPVKDVFGGIPEFDYEPGHPADARWDYHIKEKGTNGGDDLAVFRKDGGPQNHRFYPAPSVKGK